jgi:hypothetical protein
LRNIQSVVGTGALCTWPGERARSARVRDHSQVRGSALHLGDLGLSVLVAADVDDDPVGEAVGA